MTELSLGELKRCLWNRGLGRTGGKLSVRSYFLRHSSYHVESLEVTEGVSKVLF